FATLDPTMRGVALPTGRKVILSDTVGFISDLPTQLVAAFRATLEEVLEADLILHVRDIAHPETAEQAADVAEILESLGVGADVPLIEVWNKIDLVPAAARPSLMASAAAREQVRTLSAITGEGIDGLLAAMDAALSEERFEVTLKLGFDEGRRRAWLHAQGVVLNEHQDEDGHVLHIRWSDRQRRAYLAF